MTDDPRPEDVTLHLGGSQAPPERCECGREFQPIPGVTLPGLCLFCSSPSSIEDLIGD
jgi:hypothetical protein